MGYYDDNDDNDDDDEEDDDDDDDSTWSLCEWDHPWRSSTAHVPGDYHPLPELLVGIVQAFEEAERLKRPQGNPSKHLNCAARASKPRTISRVVMDVLQAMSRHEFLHTVQEVVRLARRVASLAEGERCTQQRQTTGLSASESEQYGEVNASRRWKWTKRSTLKLQCLCLFGLTSMAIELMHVAVKLSLKP